MVESPTYYHSLSPVLRSLKEFDMENFPLQAEIIYAKPSMKLPDYLKEATFRTAIVCPRKTTASTGVEGEKDDSTLGECEEEDVEESEDLDEQSLCASAGIDFSSISGFDEETNFGVGLEESKEEGTKESEEESPEEGEEEDYYSSEESEEEEGPEEGEEEDCYSSDESEEEEGTEEGDEEDCYSSDESEEEEGTEETCSNNSEAYEEQEEFYALDEHEVDGTFSCGVEQMDNDFIPQDILEATFSSKAEGSDDIKEPISTATLTDDNSSARNPSEPQEKSSKKKLGHRMEVEQFLELFNSSSDSYLEASQCEALVHALKNRLAVIQGKRH